MAQAQQQPQPQRLNYIGSKYQLLPWLEEQILTQTGWKSFHGKKIGDLFAGTGIVSYTLRQKGAATIANDAEPYSAIITAALSQSTATPSILAILNTLQAELSQITSLSPKGPITLNYSPDGPAERQFFTTLNAQKIDHLRGRIAALKPTLSTADYNFLLASLLLAADKVANVPAVYGCYLKSFKKTALQPLILRPPHELTTPPSPYSQTTNADTTSAAFLSTLPEMDLVYLDPPYNERQYSKNYFPLNMIAEEPLSSSSTPITLKGKTGIPSNCFLSTLCQKKNVAAAFDIIVANVKADWIVISYNSESLLPRDKMQDILKKYGTLTTIERPYKRFKSFEYNKDTEICEYLFILQKTPRSTPSA